MTMLKGVGEIAEYAGVTRKTVYNWINQQALPILRDPDTHRPQISTASIDLWLTAIQNITRRKQKTLLQSSQARIREQNKRKLLKRWKPIPAKDPRGTKSNLRLID